MKSTKKTLGWWTTLDS